MCSPESVSLLSTNWPFDISTRRRRRRRLGTEMEVGWIKKDKVDGGRRATTTSETTMNRLELNVCGGFE